MLVALPIFYLSILTIFLLVLSYIISQQLKTIFLLESQFKYFTDKSQNGTLDREESFAFAKVCVAKKYFAQAIIESQTVLTNSDYSRVSDSNQIIANLYNMLGFIYDEASQERFAKDFYERAVELDPNYITALNNLAKIYEDTKDYAKAENLYDRVLMINSNNQTANSRKQFIEKLTIT